MRRLCLFTALFIILAGLYWLLEGPEKNNASREPDTVLKGFSSANAGRITLTAPPADVTVLQRIDAGWQVSTAGQDTVYAADSSAVQKLLSNLAALKTGTVVSRNSKRHALYEVSPETGLLIEVADNAKRPLASLLIGKNGPNIFSTYVRAADSDAVYLVDGILKDKVSKTLNEWRDKNIFALEPGAIHAYTVAGDTRLNLQKSSGEWQAGDVEVSAEAVGRLLESFATLGAVDFAEGPLEEFGLDKPLRIITAEIDNETQATLLFGSAANAFQQYAKTADSDTIYIIEKHLLSMLCPALEELKAPEEEPSAEPIDTQPAAAQEENIDNKVKF